MVEKDLTPYRLPLLITAAILTVIGLLAIYAASSITANQKFHDELFFVKRQAFGAFVGFLIIFIVGHLPIRFLERLTLPLLLLSFMLCVMTLIPPLSPKIKGAHRWVQILGMQFQPIEITKIAFVIFLAKNLGRESFDIHSFWKALFPVIILFLSFAGVLMLQPDFGSTVLLFLLTFLMLFVAGVDKKYIFANIILGIAAIGLAIYQKPYRLQRLFSFLDPWQEREGSGFQIIQSYLGFQNGGIFGVGFGESKQKLFFLPDAHNDFILSVIAEELGLVGVFITISLFLYLLFLGFQIMRFQGISYRKFLAFGITTLIALETIINFGVTMGILPTKGMPLPFVSYGRSSLISFLFAIAILARLCHEEVKN